MNLLVLMGFVESGQYDFYYYYMALKSIDHIEGDHMIISRAVSPNHVSRRLQKYGVKNIKKVLGVSKYIENPSWSCAYSILDRMKKHFSKYDGLLLVGAKEGDLGIGEIQAKVAESDTFKSTWVSGRRTYRATMLAHELSKMIPVYHFVIDPLEPDYSDHMSRLTRLFFYYNGSKNLKYYPYVEYAHIYNQENIEVEKKFNFTFGVTSLIYSGIKNWRDSFIDWLTEVKIKDSNIYITSQKYKMKNWVDKDIYDIRHAQSYSTLIIPSNDVDEFSYIRFVEAIEAGVVPYIMETCQWEKAFIHSPQIAEIIPDLIVNENTLEDRATNSKDDRSIIDRIRATDDWQKYKNNLEFYLEWCRRTFDA